MEFGDVVRNAEVVAALLSFRGGGDNGIASCLQGASELCRVDGCVLWLGHSQADHRLFPVAEWFAQEKSYLTYLQGTSLTAKLAQGGVPMCFSRCDVEDLPDHAPDIDLMALLGAQSCCVVPVFRNDALIDSLELAGCVGFYRFEPATYPEEAVDLAAKLAPLVFQQFEDKQDRNTINLLYAIDKKLHLKLNAEQPDLFSEPFRHQLTDVLRLVLQTFNCLEGGIYLQDPGESSHELRLAAGLAEKIPSFKFEDRYLPGEGLTGQCFQQREYIFFPDLRRLNKEEMGAQWKARLDPTVPLEEQEGREGELPPWSFLAVPIFDAGSVLGVLRCSIVRSAPYYFADSHAKLLRLVANMVGDWCGNILSFWRTHHYVAGMSDLNQRAHDVVRRGAPDHHALHTQALMTVATAIPEAHSCCLRLVDETKKQLIFSNHFPELNSKLGVATRQQTTDLPLESVSNPSAAADAFTSKRVIEVSTFQGHPRYVNRFFANETDALVVAPVLSGNTTYGTIEVRFRRGENISRQAVAMLKLLGSQLGLFFSLGQGVRDHAATTQRLHTTLSRLNTTLAAKLLAFRILEHQIYTPLMKANMKAKRLYGELQAERPMREAARALFAEDFLSLRGNLRQAELVAASVKLFVDLAEEKPLTIKWTTLTQKDLLERFTRAISEMNAIVTRKITFEADYESFGVLAKTGVQVATNLLDQMIDNLMDNAEKYGRRKSKAEVKVGITHQGRYFFISIGNQGLPVDQQTAQSLMKLGERSIHAAAGEEEGSGLGLYLVNKFMRAHGGYLEILPTDRVTGFAYFRLLFPTGIRSK